MARGGVSVSGIKAFKYYTFPPILNQFLKDPGPLNSKKRF
jgi:hypothetical protein